ncbi:MAG: YggS family pyridoxal phosphate-dependent enzyme [Clostridium sp.]|nr:YggS family pyridoxal phosphate-dependent enzyme [Clostridium sp.]
MTAIQQQITDIIRELPPSVQLVAVSKYHPAECILDAYGCGQRVFGESHALELRDKHEKLPKDIRWHFIGHLQSNKVKYIIGFVDLIHAVDSVKLLREIEKQAAKVGRTVRCLLQIHVAQEESKYGFTPEEYMEFLANGEWQQMTHIRLCGVMCMASNVDDQRQIREEFHQARVCFQQAKEQYFKDEDSFCECSWGMSEDYPIAIEEGSTLVRVGSKIFGSRQ